MTQLPSSSEKLQPSPTSEHNPQRPAIYINDEPQPSPQARSTYTRTPITRKQRNATGLGLLYSLWYRAGLLTVLIVFIAYMWLSWTDPDQIEMRKMAWEAALEKIQGKKVVYAQRYSDQYRFRPAASPIITETLTDGRTKIRGARHGDNVPIPTSTGSEAIKTKKKDRRRRNKKRN